MLKSDMALVEDEKMKEFVEKFAFDGDEFDNSFVKAWVKLQELGCDHLKDDL